MSCLILRILLTLMRRRNVFTQSHETSARVFLACGGQKYDKREGQETKLCRGRNSFAKDMLFARSLQMVDNSHVFCLSTKRPGMRPLSHRSKPVLKESNLGSCIPAALFHFRRITKHRQWSAVLDKGAENQQLTLSDATEQRSRTVRFATLPRFWKPWLF